MKGLLIAFAVVASALARPDIGLKLRQGYIPPSTSYGVPTGSYLPALQHSSSSSQFHDTASTFQAPSYSGNNHHTGFIQTAGVGAGHTSQYSGDFNGGASHQNYDFNADVINSNYGQEHYQGGASQVQKHVYFFDSPEDLPAPQFRISGGTSAPQKNYKIIFIKAPSYQAPQIPHIPAQAANEEKTLVYVLVKKNEDIQDIVLPSASPAKQTKPEVFFIKYNSKQDAEAQIRQIQQGQHTGVNANDVHDESALVNSIQETRQSATVHSHSDSHGSIGGGVGGSFSSGSHGSIGGISGTHGGVSGGHHQQHQQQQQQSHYQTSASNNFGPFQGSGPYH